MKKSDFLKQQRASKVEAQGKLLSLRTAETRDFTEAEQTSFEALEGEITALDEEIRKAVQVETAEARHAEMNAKPVTHDLGTGEQRENEKMK